VSEEEEEEGGVGSRVYANLCMPGRTTPTWHRRDAPVNYRFAPRGSRTSVLLMLQASAWWHPRACAIFAERRNSETLLHRNSREESREYAARCWCSKSGTRVFENKIGATSLPVSRSGGRERETSQPRFGRRVSKGLLVPRFTASVLLPELARVLDTTGDTAAVWRCLESRLFLFQTSRRRRGIPGDASTNGKR